MSEAFYSDGLRFECRRCSACCRGEPGFVFLTRPDVLRILKRLGIDFRTFYADYCRSTDTGLGMALSLKEKPGYDCVFWGEEGCSIYEDRPVQCSTYPFWASILESRSRWDEESAYCPGVGKGELRGGASIEERLERRRAEKILIFEYEEDPQAADIDGEARRGQ